MSSSLYTKSDWKVNIFSALYRHSIYEFYTEFTKNLSRSYIAFARCKITCIWSHKKESNLHRSQSFSALNTYNTHGNVENCWSLIATFSLGTIQVISQKVKEQVCYIYQKCWKPHMVWHLILRIWWKECSVLSVLSVSAYTRMSLC